MILILIAVGLSVLFKDAMPAVEPLVATSTSATTTAVMSTSTTTTSGATSSATVRYVDPVWKFSINIPKGWAPKVLENSTTTSRYDMFFAEASKITSGVASPEPAIVVTRIDLTRADTAQSSGSETIKNILRDQGQDAVIEYVIEGLRKKSFPGYTVSSNTKKTIGGKIFYEILASYVGNKTGKGVTINDYIYIDDSVMYDMQMIMYSENLLVYKAMVEKAMYSLEI